jgi:hypothetical protein
MCVVPGPASQDAVIKRVYASPGLQCSVGARVVKALEWSLGCDGPSVGSRVVKALEWSREYEYLGLEPRGCERPGGELHTAYLASCTFFCCIAE